MKIEMSSFTVMSQVSENEQIAVRKRSMGPWLLHYLFDEREWSTCNLRFHVLHLQALIQELWSRMS